MAAEWSSFSKPCFLHTAWWVSSATCRFLPRERALIHSECPQLSRGALIVINVCFSSSPQPQSLHRWRPSWRRRQKGSNEQSMITFSCFTWFITLVAEHLVSEGCVLRCALCFPLMHHGAYASFHRGCSAAEIQGSSTDNLQITSHKDPPSKSYTHTLLSHEDLFDPAVLRHEKWRHSAIHHFPYIIDHIQTR